VNKIISLAALCMLVSGCTKGCASDPEPPKTVGCPDACAKLRAFGCPEGLSEHCVAVCTEIQESGYLEVDVQCVINAKDAIQIKECGVCGS
jgi:hypothetical protein